MLFDDYADVCCRNYVKLVTTTTITPFGVLRVFLVRNEKHKNLRSSYNRYNNVIIAVDITTTHLYIYYYKRLFVRYYFNTCDVCCNDFYF